MNWISVKDELPEITATGFSDLVLVCFRDETGLPFYALACCWEEGVWDNRINVTHWHVLPPLPFIQSLTAV